MRDFMLDVGDTLFSKEKRGYTLGAIFLVLVAVTLWMIVQSDWQQMRTLNNNLETTQAAITATQEDLQTLERTLERLEALRPNLNTKEGATAWLELQLQVQGERESMAQKLAKQHFERGLLSDRIMLLQTRGGK